MSPEASQPALPPPVAAASGPERYRVLFPLGRGGMGSVEVALEEQGAFRRIVALKTMLTESSRDQRQKEMFLREARLARMLNHPNVVHAFAAGAEEERLYICMEYVEGASLSLLLARARELEGGLSPALTAYLLAELCDGLHAAHELRDEEGKSLGVVHRDVSPHNVMVAYAGHVKVLDFGIAKIDESKLTHTGEVKGKTAYMAPEQALGEELDRRSDLFAVGAVLYECVAAARMWGPGSDVEVIRRLALEEAPRLADTVPDAPKELAELQARLVARDPAGRPGTAAEVADSLRRYLAGCSPRADEAALRATMQRLFELEAAQRRHQLARALEGVVDRAGADALKKSLSTATAPLSDSERRMLAALRPRTGGASEAAATPLEVEAPVPPPPRRSALPLVATVAALAAVGALLFARMSSSSLAEPEVRAVAPSPVTTATVTALATTETPIATTTATAKTSPATAATPDGGAAPRPRAAPARPRPQGAAAPSSPTPARPEIDTRAF
jgi:hypothetical protein